MFTGLVEEKGAIHSITPIDDSARITVTARVVLEDVSHGASIAVNGVCLTVVASDAHTFTVDVMRESLERSSLGALVPGSPVNLERAAQVGDRLGGHIVQGHVDAVSTLISVTPHEQWRVLRFTLSPDIAPLVVDKGSITVSGVSLTISAVSEPEADEHWFEVSLIPETIEATILGQLTPGATVNIETDMIARHVQRLAAFAQGENS